MPLTLDEAKEVFDNILTFVQSGDPPEEHDALKLGIEAFKREKYNREHQPYLTCGTLPGEAEEAKHGNQT